MIMNLLLKMFVLVHGLGAASGLVYEHKQLYLVSDDQAIVYHYDFKNHRQNEINLLPQSTSKTMDKKDKFDFESVVLYENKLYCLGSGSKANRNALWIVDLASKHAEMFDLSSIYLDLRTRFAIAEKDFNIEGFIYHDGYTYLLNRGNGNNQRNAIFKFKGLPQDTNLSQVTFIEVSLPLVDGHQTTFSDGIIVDNQIIFTATIEVESDIQHDGLVKESIIGAIDLASYALKNYQVIASNQKIEGITLRKKSNNYYNFLLCEDNDDGSDAAKVFELKISKDLTHIK